MTGMHMGQSPGPVYGGPVQRRPAPYPNPMYMANKRQQQPGMFHPAMNQVKKNSGLCHKHIMIINDAFRAVSE